MADHDVMAVDAQVKASSEPAIARRDSIEDADPTLTRKRQRLEMPVENGQRPELQARQPWEESSKLVHVNGHRAREPACVARSSPPAAISPWSPAATAQAARPASAPASPSPSLSVARLSADAMGRRERPRLSRTASKVTINVRGGAPPPEIGSDDAPTAASATDRDHSMRDPSAPEPEPQRDPDRELEPEPEPEPKPVPAPSSAPAPAPTERSATNSEDPVGPFSPSNSSVRSPEVEIAEVEEMDQDYAVTDWDPVVRVVEEEDHHSLLVEKFPYYGKNCDVKDAIHSISRNLEKGIADGAAMAEIANWLALCLHRAQRYNLDWYELYMENQPFWDEVPSICDALLKRRVPLPDRFFRRPSPEAAAPDAQPFEDLFVRFVQLAVHLIRADINTLQTTEVSSQEPELVSVRYQTMLYWILFGSNATEVPLYRLLQEYHAFDLDRFSAHLARLVLTDTTRPLELLTTFADLVLIRIPRCPRLNKTLLTSFWISQRLVAIANERCTTLGPDAETIPHLWRCLPTEAAAFARDFDAQLRVLIEKQANLTREFVKDLGCYLYPLLGEVALAGVEVASALLREKEVDVPPEVDPDQLSPLVARAWKFSFLLKCLVSGRMETRVQALDIMSTDLVETFKMHNNSRASQALMRMQADFIIAHQLVEYLVGVDSHIQLAERATNIPGFLVVTHLFTDRHSDAIWHVVRTNQDPRFVAAILRMLRGCFNIAQYPTLLYLCQKLNEVPLASFDAAIIEFATALLAALREKFRVVSSSRLDMPPYDLCIKLIRQATASPADPVDGPSSIAHFALRELHELLFLGPSAEDRRSFYLECLQDIIQKDACSTGSICVINAFLQPTHTASEASDELDALTREFNLTRLLIEETAHTLGRKSPRLALPNAEIILSSRLDLLGRIITWAPSTIDEGLGERLWKCIAENEALSAAQRDLGWGMLGAVTARLRARNVFIDQCVDVHLPHLQPQFFTPGVLSMAQQIIQYEHRVAPRRPPSEHEIIQISGSDLVWRIILTAPDRTIEEPAIKYLVGQYLDAAIVRDAPQSSVEATHLALVDRCVCQLTSAAAKLKAFGEGTMSGEDEPMVIVATDAEMKAEELRFGRSLMLLREILHGMRERPHYSPRVPRAAPTGATPAASHAADGVVVRLRYQAFPKDARQQALTELEINDLETGKTLKHRLSEATGFAHFRTISGGREVDLDGQAAQIVRDLQIGSQPLMITERPKPNPNPHPEPDATPNLPPNAAHAHLSYVEVELLKHFDELYGLLALEEKLAEQIWELLNAFPPQEKIYQMIRNEDSTSAVVFPAGHPFKVIYSATAMRLLLDRIAQDPGLPEKRFISHCVRLVLAALSNDALLDAVANEHLKIKAISGLIHCLMRFLQVAVPGDVSTAFNGEVHIVDRLLQFIERSRSPAMWAHEEAAMLACDSFHCLLQASSQNAQIWNSFSHREDVPALLEHLLLVDLRVRLRASIAHLIANVCSFEARPCQVAPRDMALFFWRIVSGLLPATADATKQRQCSELLDASLTLLQAIGDVWREPLELDAYVNSWGTLLAGHHHEETVGQDTVDPFVYGFARLLNYCVKLARSTGQHITSSDLAEKIFTGFLFPSLSTGPASERIVEGIPVLHTASRKELNELVLLLSHDLTHYAKTIRLLSELVPSSSTFPLVWNWQRAKSIRSPTGYVGLYNLSNTCYLNSLFTQLFMNVAFRGFMLQANVPDAAGSQRLLSETQKLFAHMQNSWQVAVEPKELAGSIRTYENENIDVTIQMDVDEFYNLLFDRWEGQILSDDDKKVFRSFYGGQLVQQVKSKECPHVSEREEPFSAIQCDIKGKSTLQDSLKAYVEGDMMEGDNKYSCTSCNRHVDAVKRTCLKEIPDNLIFHLKRFDFDLRTMQRSKINDHFEFPLTIDMRPYKVEQLSDPAVSTPEDIFELVGVLVHSGTAESGHYYSFVRERPITRISRFPDWVHYNDSEVQYWDPANIAAQCYGGSESWPRTRESQPIMLPKSYSAYMLFYQRATSIMDEQMAHQHQSRSVSPTEPKKEPVSTELGNHIALENELFIRKYCLYDEHHAFFVRWMFELLGSFHDGTCSTDHSLEQTAIHMALHHVDQVLARTKEIPFFDDMTAALLRRMSTCVGCSTLVLDWVANFPEATRNLLLRSPSARVRQEFARLMAIGLREVKTKDPSGYGIDAADDKWKEERREEESGGVFVSVLERLESFWEVIDIHLRAWDEYFGLLSQMASLGDIETFLVLRCYFLRRCLEILVVEMDLTLRPTYERLLRAFGKGRKASYCKLIELVRVLLRGANLHGKQLARDEEDRFRFDPPVQYPLTKMEYHYMRLAIPRGKCVAFLQKVLETNHNPGAATRIVTQIIKAEPQFGLLGVMVRTLVTGITSDPASLAAPFLLAAVTVCQFAPSPQDVKEMIAKTAKGIDTIGVHGGREHLAFFTSLAQLSNDRWTGIPHWFRFRVLEYVQFWAPPLLLYWDPDVRQETERLLQEMLFVFGFPASAEDLSLRERMHRAGQELGTACLNKLVERFVQNHSSVEKKLLESMLRVVHTCRIYFDDDDEMADFDRKCERVINELRSLVIEEEVDDIASEDEWDSNAVSSSSEVEVGLQGESSP
ncbi:MAG: hypothetical protein M1826_005069 [Phylliscum demangeonii]|nr:MAG: hypothetical protein M1826_005069 [Phylliscum demangeonii]